VTEGIMAVANPISPLENILAFIIQNTNPKPAIAAVVSIKKIEFKYNVLLILFFDTEYSWGSDITNFVLN
jgi:hypothetical protein